MTSTEKFTNNKNAWRFKFAISAILIAFLLGVTLRKLTDFGSTIEMESVKSQVRSFKLGLTEAWVNRNINHKSTNISVFENTNPMLLISDVPKNYIGEHAQAPSGEKAVWYFDKNNRQLIYVSNSGALLRFKLVKSTLNHQKPAIPNGGLDLVSVE